MMYMLGDRTGGATSTRAKLALAVSLLLFSSFASCQPILRATRLLQPVASDGAVPEARTTATLPADTTSTIDSSPVGGTDMTSPDRSIINAILAAANSPSAAAAQSPAAAAARPMAGNSPSDAAIGSITNTPAPARGPQGGTTGDAADSTANAISTPSAAGTADDTTIQAVTATDNMQRPARGPQGGTTGDAADSATDAVSTPAVGAADDTPSSAVGTTDNMQEPARGPQGGTTGSTASPTRPSDPNSKGKKHAGVAGRPGFIATGAKPATKTPEMNATYCLTAADTNSTSSKGSNKTAAVKLQMCDASTAEQVWQLRYNGALNGVGTEACLDAESAKSKSSIITATCNKDSLTQKWFLDGVGRLHPYAAPDMCIDVGSTAANRSSEAYDPKSGFVLSECSLKRGSQYFAAAGLYPPDLRASNQRIGLRANQNCLDTYDYKSAPDMKVRPAVLSKCGSEVKTQFWTYGVTTGYLVNTGIEPVNTFCMQATNDTVGSAIRVKKCGKKANTMPETLKDTQRWFRDAFLRLRPYSAPELCVDVIQNSFLPEGSNSDVTVADDDVVLILNQCKASATQQWLGEMPSQGSNDTAAAGGAGSTGSIPGRGSGQLGVSGRGGVLGQRQAMGQYSSVGPQNMGQLGVILGRLASAAAQRNAGSRPAQDPRAAPVAAAASQGVSGPQNAAIISRP